MISVAVVEENEILRRGVIAALAEDRSLNVVEVPARRVREEEFDVAVVSTEAASSTRFACPIIINVDASAEPLPAGEEAVVAARLCGGGMTAAQLRAIVHAAAAGLKVATSERHPSEPPLDPRYRRLLELLADGRTTREIAELMSYSERTIKKLIANLEHRFQARTRAHMVAQAIRRGLI